MERRFSFRGSRNIHLVAGLLIFTIMTLTLGEIEEDIRTHAPITIIDTKLSGWLHTHSSPPLTAALWIITTLHGTWPIALSAFAIGNRLRLKRERYWLAAVWLTVYGGMLLNWTLKLVFQRARPAFAEPILTLTGYSFPSGHTMMATTLYGVLAVYLVSHTRSSGRRALVITVASIMIALVGSSRIYLGAHYLSDVLGAAAEGLAWMSLCLTVVYSVQRHRAKNKRAEEALQPAKWKWLSFR